MKDQQEEVKEMLLDVLNRWCPENFSHEEFNVRMIRALLHLNAYEMDYKRVKEGKNPIRMGYPLELPS